MMKVFYGLSIENSILLKLDGGGGEVNVMEVTLQVPLNC
jgi:hypothetical protein